MDEKFAITDVMKVNIEKPHPLHFLISYKIKLGVNVKNSKFSFTLNPECKQHGPP